MFWVESVSCQLIIDQSNLAAYAVQLRCSCGLPAAFVLFGLGGLKNAIAQVLGRDSPSSVVWLENAVPLFMDANAR